MSIKTDLRIETNHVLGAVAVVVVGFVVWRGYKKAGQIVSGAVEKVNPASSNNFINQGVESLGKKISGDKNWTLGGWVYDKLHGDVMPQIINTTTAAGDRLIKLDNQEAISE